MIALRLLRRVPSIAMRVGALMLAQLAVFCAALAIAGCGDDNGDPPVDASGGAATDSAPGADGSSQSGTQGPGQFCDTLPEGGPYCEDGLDCCDDGVCRGPDDCPGSGGYIPCTDGDSCPTSKICCEIPSMTFCTKPSACSDYGGEEIP